MIFEFYRLFGFGVVGKLYKMLLHPNAYCDGCLFRLASNLAVLLLFPMLAELIDLLCKITYRLSQG